MLLCGERKSFAETKAKYFSFAKQLKPQIAGLLFANVFIKQRGLFFLFSSAPFYPPKMHGELYVLKWGSCKNVRLHKTCRSFDAVGLAVVYVCPSEKTFHFSACQVIRKSAGRKKKGGKENNISMLRLHKITNLYWGKCTISFFFSSFHWGGTKSQNMRYLLDFLKDFHILGTQCLTHSRCSDIL